MSASKHSTGATSRGRNLGRDRNALRPWHLLGSLLLTIGLLFAGVAVATGELLNVVGTPGGAARTARTVLDGPKVRNLLAGELVTRAEEDAGLPTIGAIHEALVVEASSILSREAVRSLVGEAAAALWRVHLGTAETVTVDLTPALREVYLRLHARVAIIPSVPPRTMEIQVNGGGMGRVWLAMLVRAHLWACWIGLALVSLGLGCTRGGILRRLSALGWRLVVGGTLATAATFALERVQIGGRLGIAAALLADLSDRIRPGALLTTALGIGLVIFGLLARRRSSI